VKGTILQSELLSNSMIPEPEERKLNIYGCVQKCAYKLTCFPHSVSLFRFNTCANSQFKLRSRASHKSALSELDRDNLYWSKKILTHPVYTVSISYKLGQNEVKIF